MSNTVIVNVRTFGSKLFSYQVATLNEDGSPNVIKQVNISRPEEKGLHRKVIGNWMRFHVEDYRRMSESDDIGRYSISNNLTCHYIVNKVKGQAALRF